MTSSRSAVADSKPRRNHGSAPPRLKPWHKAAYGIGQFAEGVVTIVFMIFLLFYYNQVLGLSGSATGFALFIALLVDAISDPLMGAISDRTRSTLGRRHPYLYLAVLPLPVFFYLLFAPPAELSQTGLFVWLIAFSVLSRLALTIFFVPHLALGAELSNDYRERNQIVAFRQFFSMLGYFAALAIGFGAFFYATPDYPNGQMNPNAYAPFAAVMAVILATVMLVTAIGTHRFIPFLHGSIQLPAKQKRSFVPPFWSDTATALRNYSFRILIGGLLIFYVAFGVRTSLGLHLYTHYWALTTEEVELVTITTILALIGGVIFWAFVGQAIEKRTGFILGFVGWVVLTAWPVIQMMVGLYPDRGGPSYVGILLWTGILASVMGAATNVFGGSMIADCLDENELDTGERQEGAFFGAYTVTAKATTGLGTWLGGLALDAIAFPQNAAPGAVSADTLQKLGFLTGPLLLVCGLSALFLLFRYRLSKVRLAQIQQALGRP